MPFLPDTQQVVNDGASYCRQARLIADTVAGRVNPPALHFQTTPHAPLSRRYGQVEGSLLYAVESHLPEQIYHGWVICDGAADAEVRRALGLLPWIPFGGKGKFTAAEARIIDEIPPQTLVDTLALSIQQQSGADNEIEIELLTPLVLHGSDLGLMAQAIRLRPQPPRRYRVWRTGIYPDITLEERERPYGARLDSADLPLAWQHSGPYFAGQSSEAVLALPEGSRFAFAPEQTAAVAHSFVAGTGRADWAALGWGQIFVYL
jgi:hypothetical protein